MKLGRGVPLTAFVIAALIGPPASAAGTRHSTLIEQLADCVVREKPGLAERLLASAHGGIEEFGLARTIAKSATRCMRNSRLGMPTWILRGAVAGAWLRASARALDQARSLPIRAPVRVPAASDNGVFMRMLSTCVVEAAPQESADLVAASADEAAAKRAVGALGPALSACIPETVELRINPPELRANLADAVYRRLLPGQQRQ